MRCSTGLVLALCALVFCLAHPGLAQEKKEGKSGKTVGMLTAKGEKFIEVKAAGEEKGRKFVPRWLGGAPAQGGGLDKAMLKTFSELQVGSRLEVEWTFDERLRAVKITVLQKPEKK